MAGDEDGGTRKDADDDGEIKAIRGPRPSISREIAERTIDPDRPIRPPRPQGPPPPDDE